ncbi:ammonia channel protein, partial [Ralstonia solanacearum]|nr:ammonia channel protein [Ralstonia solanacearum]
MKTWFTRFLTAGAVAAVLAGAVISAPAMAQDKPAASAPAAEASAPAAAAAASEPAAASAAT